MKKELRVSLCNVSLHIQVPFRRGRLYQVGVRAVRFSHLDVNVCVMKLMLMLMCFGFLARHTTQNIVGQIAAFAQNSASQYEDE